MIPTNITATKDFLRLSFATRPPKAEFLATFQPQIGNEIFVNGEARFVDWNSVGVASGSGEIVIKLS